MSIWYCAEHGVTGPMACCAKAGRATLEPPQVPPSLPDAPPTPPSSPPREGESEIGCTCFADNVTNHLPSCPLFYQPAASLPPIPETRGSDGEALVARAIGFMVDYAHEAAAGASSAEHHDILGERSADREQQRIRLEAEAWFRAQFASAPPAGSDARERHLKWLRQARDYCATHGAYLDELEMIDEAIADYARLAAHPAGTPREGKP